MIMTSCFEGIIAYVKDDSHLMKLDRQMDEANSLYEMRFDWLEKRYAVRERYVKDVLKGDTWGDACLKWLTEKNLELYNAYSAAMKDLTEKLADHMEAQGKLPDGFDKSLHYIGITTKGEVYVTDRINQERQRNYV